LLAEIFTLPVSRNLFLVGVPKIWAQCVLNLYGAKKMNMISTGAFLTEMDASNKQLTLADKFAAVWEKKNAKAARAGGVSLMALSLAACGGSSSTTTTTTTTTTDTSTDTTTTDTTPAGSSYTLTTASAGDQFALTAGNDTVTGTGSTYQAVDTILDTTTTDNDVLTLSVTGDVSATPTVTNVETINITHTGFTSGTNPTILEIDVASVTGATTFNIAQDAVTSINEVDIDNLATGQTVNTAVATTDLDAIDDNAAITVGTTASSTTATSTVEVTSAGALTALTVDETTGHLDLDVTTGDLDGTLTVTSAQDADVSADAATSATVTAGRDVTITSLAAAKTVTITAGRDVSDAAADLLDAATSVTITAGRQVNGVDMDAATTATISAAGVDASATGGANRASSITGDALTTLNVSGNGGALEITTNDMSDTLATINVTGDQSVTVNANGATLDSLTKLTMTDATTAGTTTLVIGNATLDNDINLSGVAESVVMRMDVNEANADVITLPANSNIVFNAAQGDLDITAASATASSNTTNLSVDKANATTSTYALTALTSTNIKNVNVDLSVDTASTTIGTWDIGAANNLSVTHGANAITSATAITAGKLTLTGSGAVDLDDNAVVSTVDASAATGAITVIANGTNGIDVIQTGSGDDVTTATDINVNISTGAGSDTHNLSGDLTTAGTNTSYVLDMGTGTTDTLNVAASSNTNSSAVSLSGFNKIVLAGDATMRDTQLSGVSAAVFGATDSDLTIGISQATNDFSGLTVDTATMSTADGDSFSMDASSFTTSAVTITGTGFDDTIKGSSQAIYAADTLNGGGGADSIFVTEGGDAVDGGAGTDTIDFTLIDDAFTDVEGGTSDPTGIVINLSTSAVNSGTISAAMGTSYMSASDTSIAAGEFGYLFSTNAAANSAVVGTVTKVENVNGTTGADYIVGSTAANVITAGNGNDHIVLQTGSNADVVHLSAFASNGSDVITGFDTTEDHLNLDVVMTGVTDVVAVTDIAAGGKEADFIDNEVYVFADGATAETTGGTDVIADYTNLEDVAGFISDNLTLGDSGGSNDQVAGDEAVFVINDLAADLTYVYHFKAANTGDASGGDTVAASELTLIATVTEESGAALVAADIV